MASGMICPYRKMYIRKKEINKRVTEEYFMNCERDICPFYTGNSGCGRVLRELQEVCFDDE